MTLNSGQAGAADFLTFLGLGFGPDDNIKDVIDYNNIERKVGFWRNFEFLCTDFRKYLKGKLFEKIR